MNSHYLSNKVGRIVVATFFLVAVGMVSTASAQYYPYPNQNNQDPYYRQGRDRDYRRDDRYGRNGGNNSAYQIAANQGYQDGMYTGQTDAARRQNYNPQRSHFYRNGHGDNGGYGGYGGYGNNGRYGNSYQYQQAYRQGFLQGYDQGYQRYGGNRRNNGRYGNRWPF